MLVIRRRTGESILVGDEVEIQILDISPTRVKLGIVAPSRVDILRKEVKLTQEQNLIAARGVTEVGIQSVLRGLSTVLDSASNSIGKKP